MSTTPPPGPDRPPRFRPMPTAPPCDDARLEQRWAALCDAERRAIVERESERDRGSAVRFVDLSEDDQAQHPHIDDHYLEPHNSAGGVTEWAIAEIGIRDGFFSDGVRLIDADPTRAEQGHTRLQSLAGFRGDLDSGRLRLVAAASESDHGPARIAGVVRRVREGLRTKDGVVSPVAPDAGVTAAEHPPSPADRNRYGRTSEFPLRIAVFVGVDPGNTGAASVISCLDTPETDETHGRICAVQVVDLPTVARDGGRELDVVGFGGLLHEAIGQVMGDGVVMVPTVRAVVERPQVAGGMGRGAVQVVTQAINAGAAWAVVVSVCCGWAEGADACVEWASSRARGGWRDEVGCQKGNESLKAAMLHLQAVVDPATNKYSEAVAGQVFSAIGPTADDLRLRKADLNPLLGDVAHPNRVDRCVSLLLAETARRRWLGLPPAVTAKTSPADPKAAKARARDRREAALERAVAPLTVAKARPTAWFHARCRVHSAQEGASCLPRNRCCEARLLDWAWRQRPDLPSLPVEGTAARAALRLLGEAIRVERRPATAKVWTMDGASGEKIDDAVFSVLHDHGLVVLEAGSKRVWYVVTERGREWCRRARATAVPRGGGGDAAAE